MDSRRTASLEKKIYENMYLDVLSTQEDYHNKWYTYLLTAYQSAVEGLGAEGHRVIFNGLMRLLGLYSFWLYLQGSVAKM